MTRKRNAEYERGAMKRKKNKKFVPEYPAPLPFIETTDCLPFYFRETVKTSDGRILEERKSYFFGLFRSEKR